jgi:hypothetical protein
MASQRELKLLLQLEKHQKEAIKDFKPVPIPQINTPSTDRLIRGVENVRDIVGYDPQVLVPRDNENPNGLNPQQRLVRYRNYRERLESLNIPQLQKYNNETDEQFYRRMGGVLRNLPTQETFNIKYNTNNINLFKKHLLELMSEEDAERVMNNDLFRGNINNISIINNTWSSFVKQLKDTFKKIDVAGFIEFCTTYIQNYERTKGAKTNIVNVNVEAPAGAEEEKEEGEEYEFYYDEGESHCTFTIEVNRRRKVNVSGTISNRTREEEFKTLSSKNNKRTGAVNYFQLFKKYKLSALYGFIGAEKRKNEIDEKFLELGRAYDKQTINPSTLGLAPETSSSSWWSSLFGGSGLKKNKKLKQKILMGEIEAGNNNPILMKQLLKKMKSYK